MKLNFGLRLLGICGTLAATLLTGNARGASEPSLSPASAEKEVAPDVATMPALTLAEAQEKIAGARRYTAHPTPTPPNAPPVEPRVTSPDFEMVSPPPTPRPETKPQPPAATGYVWVPGHYMPVKGEWRWVRGEWAVPATPISVWIPARYDAKEQKWTPGYWQPDRPTAPAAAEATTKEGKPAPTAPPY